MRLLLSGCLAVLSFFAFTLVTNTVEADIELPKLFADHMVLQQNQSMRISGTADKAEQLIVKFNGQEVAAVADGNGKWSAIISTGRAGGPFQLEVASRNSETKVVFNDVLVGEVWICAGQTNMRFPVEQSKGADEHIESAKKFPMIRGFDVGQTASALPQKDFADVDSWFCCSPDSIKDFSAIAYLFGRELSKKLDVPIGLINVSSRSTTLEAWTPYDVLETDGSFDQLLKHWEERNEPTNPNRVSSSYNAMVSPLSGFAFRGVIWYQGESNVGRGAQYRRMFPLMIKSWRKKLGQPQCPFLFVQPTPFRYEEQPVEALPEIWDAQLKTFCSIQGTGMVVSTDVGCVDCNQPVEKLPIAERLSNWAFAGCYAKTLTEMEAARQKQEKLEPAESTDTGEQQKRGSAEKLENKQDKEKDNPQQTHALLRLSTNIVASGPIYESAKTHDNQIVIQFKMAAGGLYLSSDSEHGFTICGADRKFLTAQVLVSGNQLIVSHPDIPKPIAVRYGWSDTASPTLRNATGLPASPFRTDEFPLISDGVEF